MEYEDFMQQEYEYKRNGKMPGQSMMISWQPKMGGQSEKNKLNPHTLRTTDYVELKKNNHHTK